MPVRAQLFILSFFVVVYLQLVGIAVALIVRAYNSHPSDQAAGHALFRAFIEWSVQVKDGIVSISRSGVGMAADAQNALRSAVGATSAEEVAADQARRRSRANCASAVPSFGVMAAQRGGSGWIIAEEDLQALDPMAEAERAFAAASQATEARAVTETARATDHLKVLYLQAQDDGRHTLEQIEQVATLIRALRDENFAIDTALCLQRGELPLQCSTALGGEGGTAGAPAGTAGGVPARSRPAGNGGTSLVGTGSALQARLAAVDAALRKKRGER